MARGHSPPRDGWRGGGYPPDDHRSGRPRSRSRSPGSGRGGHRDHRDAPPHPRDGPWSAGRGYADEPRLSSRDYRGPPSPARRDRSRSPVRDPYTSVPLTLRGSPPRSRGARSGAPPLGSAPPWVMESGLHESVKKALDNAYQDGQLRPGHVLQSNVINLLEMPVKLALEAVDEFARINKDRVKHPAAFFSGVMRRLMEQNGYPAPTPFDPSIIKGMPGTRDRSPRRHPGPPPPGYPGPPSSSRDPLDLRAGPPRFDPYTGERLDPAEAARRFPSAPRPGDPGFGRDRKGGPDDYPHRGPPPGRGGPGAYPPDDRWQPTRMDSRDDPMRGGGGSYREMSPPRRGGRDGGRDMDLPPLRHRPPSPGRPFGRDSPRGGSGKLPMPQSILAPAPAERAPYAAGVDITPRHGSPARPSAREAAAAKGGSRRRSPSPRGGGGRYRESRDIDDVARSRDDDWSRGGAAPQVSHSAVADASDMMQEDVHINATWQGHEEEVATFDMADLVDRQQVQRAQAA